MSQAFDPYHKWLGIPIEQQPADHYRLLGIQIFESDPEVIQAAADQRMTHLRNYQTGQHSALSQRLLNEVAAARVCLLNPAKKAAYDEQLRERAREAAEAAQPEYPLESPAPPLADVLNDVTVGLERRAVMRARVAGRRKSVPRWAIVGGVVVVGVALIGAICWTAKTGPFGNSAVAVKPPGSSVEGASANSSSGGANGGEKANPTGPPIDNTNRPETVGKQSSAANPAEVATTSPKMQSPLESAGVSKSEINTAATDASWLKDLRVGMRSKRNGMPPPPPSDDQRPRGRASIPSTGARGGGEARPRTLQGRFCEGEDAR